MTYNAKRAIADFGFIEAYVRQANLPGNDVWFEAFLDSLDGIEAFIRKGYLLTGNAPPAELAGFLYDVGFIRASTWNDKIPYVVSEMMKNITRFVTGCHDWHEEMPEKPEEMLSDGQRDELYRLIEKGEDYFMPALAGEMDATEAALVRYTCQELGATDYAEAEQWADESRREWEAEKAKECPAVESGSEPEVICASDDTTADDDLASIRELSESMSDDEIAERLGVSRHTVLRYREKHGIEKKNGPREGKTRWENQWEPRQKEKLVEMRLAGHSYGEIAKAIGKTPSQCSGMWHWEKKKLEKAGKLAAPAGEEQPRTMEVFEAPSPLDVTAESDPAVETAPGGSTGEEPEGPALPDSPPTWRFDALTCDDWDDIQKMLATGRSREQIACDYDVPVDVLNGFIEDRLREGRERRAAREAQRLGEARASLH